MSTFWLLLGACCAFFLAALIVWFWWKAWRVMSETDLGVRNKNEQRFYPPTKAGSVNAQP